MSSPAWSRSAGIAAYGGHINKANYMGQGLIDARTDVGKDEINRIANDMQSMVRAAPFLLARMTLNDTSPAAPTVHWVAFQPVGEITTNFAGDSPPTGVPTFTRVGGGWVRITFAASYADDYGNSETTVLRDAGGGGAGTVYANVAGTVPTSVTAEFRVSDVNGVALDDQTITVRVY